ncbi:MAG: hypothetical protein V3S98_02995 [Dehalococcoidia bacterium]
MPIGLGLGSTHNGFMINKEVQGWHDYYQRLIRGNPQPAAAALETDEVIADYIRRVDHSFDVLRAQIAAYDPELMIIIGGDQAETFDRSNVPNLMIFLGEEMWGHSVAMGIEKSEETEVRLKVDVETSTRLLNDLVTREGFDVAFSSAQEPLGSAGTRGTGMSHAFARPAPFLMQRTNLPTVLIYENTYDPPSLSAARCYELGQALAKLLENDPRRIAILGSGGLSHDPGGPRSGWVDEQLDRWFLDQIAAGNGEATKSLYKFDSMTMRSGTGEIRSWVTVAGAMERSGSRAEVVDYMPANHAVTGIGFAYWPTVDTAVAT